MWREKRRVGRLKMTGMDVVHGDMERLGLVEVMPWTGIGVGMN